MAVDPAPPPTQRPAAPASPASLTAPTAPTATPAGMATATITSWNVHAGVDGWSHPFPVVEACRGLDSDVLVLQETWMPADGPGLAEEIARACGYRRFEEPMGWGRLGSPGERRGRGWGPVATSRPETCGVFLNEPRPLSPRHASSPRFAVGTPGSVGLAVLSRLPVLSHRLIDLGRLPRDRVHRFAIALEVAVGPSSMLVVGTHMSHLSVGSPLQFRRLRRELRALGPDRPVVVTGDMNLWGPPLRALVGDGRRRAVRGRTWPAWKPHSQIDHVLVSGPVRVLESLVLPDAGSDHRPVQVTVAPS